MAERKTKDDDRYPERAENEEKRVRRRVRPLGGQRRVFERPAREGFHRHFFNDEGTRIDDALDAGYEHVMRDGTKQKDRVLAGVNQDGSPLYAYLMEQPQEWRDEDLRISREPLREFEQAIKQGIVRKADDKDQTKFYVPEEGITVEQGVGDGPIVRQD